MAEAADFLDGLSSSACGFVWALALDAGEAGLALDAAIASVTGPEAESCRRALAALAVLPRDQRARRLTQLLGRVSAPVPPGIERVHPGWLRAALEGEASEILLAITAGLPPEVAGVAREIVAARREPPGEEGPAPIDAEDVTELRRALFAPFAAMPERGAADRPEAPACWRLATWPLERLLEELARRGAEVLGLSLAGAPPAVVARAAAHAGEPAAGIILEAVRRGASHEERDRARALVSSAAAVSSSSSASGAPLAASLAVGLLALAERWALESSESVRALAQRLPPALGQTLLSAHAAHAGRSIVTSCR